MDLILGQNLVRPASIFLLSILMSTILILLNKSNWDVVLSWKFVVYVCTAVFSFLVATVFVDILKEKKVKMLRNKVPSSSIQERRAYPSKLLLFISFLVSILFIILKFRELGFSLELSNILKQAYATTVEHNGSQSFLLNQLLKVSTAIAYVSVFQILFNRYAINRIFKQHINYINVFLFVIVTIVSTDRNILLRFFIFTAVLWGLFFTHSFKNKFKYINLKMIRKSIPYISLIILVFFFAGRLKGYTSDLNRVIGLYAGSGLYNFNIFLTNFDGTVLKMGGATFNQLLSLLSVFGFVDYAGGSPFESFIIFKSSTGFIYASNIYSALKPFVEDFGYAGVVFYPAFLGMFYQNLYNWTQKKAYDFSWGIYSLLIYPLVYVGIAEQFFARLHLGLFYEIIWFTIFYFYSTRRVVFKIK
ncbi:O-antigen polymerase [Streptococcus ovuberis]|nr:O-antigen polymerase [Streptococcus ovuberis]